MSFKDPFHLHLVVAKKASSNVITDTKYALQQQLMVMGGATVIHKC
jgi:hypothetical protein